MRSHTPFQPIEAKFCLWGRIGDVIIRAIFLENRQSAFGTTGPSNGVSCA